MKKLGLVISIAGMMAACSNGDSSTKVKLDSIGKKFDSSASRVWDSTKEKAKDIKNSIENKLERKDSAGIK
ncbi:MAG: hypothetical protein ACTHOF_09270 [Flavisolibacter sp.]|jgi:hypothetical protein